SDVVPKLLNPAIPRPPFVLERFNFGVTELPWLEFPPGVEAAHVAEGEVTGLADTPLRRQLRVGPGRHAEDLAGGFAVRLVARIAGCVIAAIAINLPFFTGNPGQDPALDRTEIRANEYPPGSGGDQAPGDVADDGERLWVKCLNMLKIAGGDRGNGGIDVLHERPLEVLRLHAIANPATRRSPVIPESAA